MLDANRWKHKGGKIHSNVEWKKIYTLKKYFHRDVGCNKICTKSISTEVKDATNFTQKVGISTEALIDKMYTQRKHFHREIGMQQNLHTKIIFHKTNTQSVSTELMDAVKGAIKVMGEKDIFHRGRNGCCQVWHWGQLSTESGGCQRVHTKTIPKISS